MLPLVIAGGIKHVLLTPLGENSGNLCLVSSRLHPSHLFSLIIVLSNLSW